MGVGGTRDSDQMLGQREQSPSGGGNQVSRGGGQGWERARNGVSWTKSSMRRSGGTLFTPVLLRSLGFLLGEVQREKPEPLEAACSSLQKLLIFLPVCS